MEGIKKTTSEYIISELNVSIKLIIDHKNKSIKIQPNLYEKFTFNGNISKLDTWKNVLKAVNKAIEFANEELNHSPVEEKDTNKLSYIKLSIDEHEMMMTNDKKFLTYTCDRLVKVHNEPEESGFIYRFRDLIKSMEEKS
jgi:hypothetical protein